MTRDEILNMPAGREIDNFVAEKVMGWHIATDQFGSDWVDSENRYQHKVSSDDYDDDENFHLIAWHPSESIMWAWEVVDEMKKRGRNFQMIQYAYNRTYATFENGLDSDNWTEANGEGCTPLAICRAALLITLEKE